MISNPNPIFYACIAKKTTILAEFSREPDLKLLAHKCIERTPSYHFMFTHTVRNRTYTFLIEDPFVYFAIFDQNLDPSEALSFLDCLKCAFKEVVKEGELVRGSENFSSHSFQVKLDPFFRKLMASDRGLSITNRNPSTDLSKGKQILSSPLLDASPTEGLKKRLSGDVGKDIAIEKKLDVGDDVNADYSKSLSFPLQKNHCLHVGDYQKAKQVWRKHVWVVLLLDLFVCLVLFVIWLWVCGGVECIK